MSKTASIYCQKRVRNVISENTILRTYLYSTSI